MLIEAGHANSIAEGRVRPSAPRDTLSNAVIDRHRWECRSSRWPVLKMPFARPREGWVCQITHSSEYDWLGGKPTYHL